MVSSETPREGEPGAAREEEEEEGLTGQSHSIGTSHRIAIKNLHFKSQSCVTPQITHGTVERFWLEEKH